MLGSTIDGKYEVQSLLGEGGMGSVYEASHTTTGRRCAVKVISSEGLTKDANVVGRFQREARAAGAIDTRYIAQVLDAGVDRDSGLPFMVVEYLDGEDLQGLLKQTGPIAPELTLRMAAQTCLGLQKAHDASVVHRDIKPANLFLTKRDAGEIIVKVLDFGIAKVKMDAAHSAEGADLTKTGNLLGSPMYMSPEQARGQRGIDHRTDVYSLGAVMYQALSGRTPYQHATALGELILFVCSEPAPPLQDHAAWVPPEVAAVVHRCLQKNPDERYQSAKEMFEELLQMLPNGYGIHESMLVSLEESERAQEAVRLQMSVPPPALAVGSAPPPMPPAPAPPDPAEDAASDAPTVVNDSAAATAATTGAAGALAHSQEVASPPSRTGLFVGGAVVMALLAGGGVYAFTQSGAPDPPPVATSVPTQEPEPTSEPSTSAETSSASEPDAKPLRVRVVIIPSDAKVEVEDEPVKVKNGILEITGTLGSIHRVRAYRSHGKGETEAEVVVTEAGALPPKIEVKAGQKLRLPRPGASSAPKDTPPAQPVVPKGISTSVDEFQ